MCLHKSQGKGNLCGGQGKIAGFLLTFLGKMVFFACFIGGKSFSEMVSDAKKTMLIFQNFLGAELFKFSQTPALDYHGSRTQDSNEILFDQTSEQV